jgi:hypothetical protein
LVEFLRRCCNCLRSAVPPGNGRSITDRNTGRTATSVSSPWPIGGRGRRHQCYARERAGWQSDRGERRRRYSLKGST